MAHIFRHNVARILLILLLIPENLLAAGRNVHMVLRPYCPNGGEVQETLFGAPLPEIKDMIDLGEGRCPSFETVDPQTRATSILGVGDTLDMELILKNTDRLPISRIRAWLAYDPTILRGTSIRVNPSFPLITPGEADFAPEEGYVKIGANTESSAPISNSTIVLARIQMEVIATPVGSTVMSFFNYQSQPSGNTLAATGVPPEESNILSSELGSLLILLEGGTASSKPSEIVPPPGPPPPLSSPSSSLGTSSASSEGGSSPPSPPPPPTAPSPPPAEDKGQGARDEGNETSFSLLQVQNLRVTTEGGAAFLGWDPLRSGRLLGYNIYYGTISGRYIHRRSISAKNTSTTIRPLPEEVTYYFAVRGVSEDTEESAFSEEVAVTIGSASTSTSPLLARLFKPPPPPRQKSLKTAEEIPGETGFSSTGLILLLISGAIGTLMASRRQFLAMKHL